MAKKLKCPYFKISKVNAVNNCKEKNNLVAKKIILQRVKLFCSEKKNKCSEKKFMQRENIFCSEKRKLVVTTKFLKLENLFVAATVARNSSNLIYTNKLNMNYNSLPNTF